MCEHVILDFSLISHVALFTSHEFSVIGESVCLGPWPYIASVKCEARAINFSLLGLI